MRDAGAETLLAGRLPAGSRVTVLDLGGGTSLRVQAAPTQGLVDLGRDVRLRGDPVGLVAEGARLGQPRQVDGTGSEQTLAWRTGPWSVEVSLRHDEPPADGDRSAGFLLSVATNVS